VVSVITEGQDGLLVRYGNVEELAATIMRLLKDADLRNKLGSKGREKVLERYTWDKIVSKMEAIYQTLIEEQLDGKRGQCFHRWQPRFHSAEVSLGETCRVCVEPGARPESRRVGAVVGAAKEGKLVN
jgi:hypothetical protein